MAKARGFLEYEREDAPKRPVRERVADYQEVEERLEIHRAERQAMRCMDCGIPFCHTFGCPVTNLIPDWNEMVARGQWEKACELLHKTNNLPEVTGRVCPAPCEPACTLSLNQPAVTIKQIELQIVERGWERGWIRPEPAAVKTGRKVAVVGSGPCGLAAAQQIARAGHEVVVFEKSDRIGGILRYGIPDFKLEKAVLDRRIEQMAAEGVRFESSVEAGVDLSVRYMQRTFDAVLIATGAGVPRDLSVPGRELAGVHFAMPYLAQQNRRNAGEEIAPADLITAQGKSVVVIGGGDTGADCVGTARRQGAREIVQIELLPEPPKERPAGNPWPTWPSVLRTSSSHEEGCTRHWGILTKGLEGDEDGRVRKARCVRLAWSAGEPGGRPACKEIPDSEFTLEADLVLLAMGFLHPEHGPLVKDYGLETSERGNVVVDGAHMTSVPGVFAAGDTVLGASLVVRAIALGREAAAGLDEYLRNLG
jgi:NAD(P)H-dependent glutamate synthase small subunit